MQKLKILNKKEAKKILKVLDEQYGFSGELDYVFMLSEKDKLFLINKDIERIDLDKVRINSMGLYFGTLAENSIRLSVEGSQIIGKKAHKNIIELDDNEAEEWFKGLDIHRKIETNGFVILKHRDDIIGCGKAVEEKILNYLPKIRRLS